MSTHATTETRDAPTAETATDEPEIEADADEPSDDGPAPMDPFDAHDAAATFGASTRRLPNTVDAENKYMGR
ncbi:hypothetical protein [Halosimplex halobium]|uniref:hypothetical protein n=1 Tax=Halosimplex halobium TaxID=3396618 RepID=UPI003F57C667